MKVLITGATGFTGGHLAVSMRNHGHEVRALVRRGSDTSALERAGVELFHGEIVDRETVRSAVRGCEQVYHIAAVYRTAGHTDDYYHAVNVGGTENILTAAREAGCERVVHCSTCGVHGHVENPPADENYRVAPDDVYQRSKLDGELKVREAIASGQPAVVFRPCAIYGEGDLRFLKLFRSIARRRFVMIGPGTTRLHMVHVDDLVDGIRLCGSRPEALGQIFLLGGPDAPMLNELSGLVARAVGVPTPRLRVPVWPVYAAGWACEMLCIPLRVNPPLHRRRVGFFTHHREFDCSKARRLIGYAPQVTAEIGVARTAAWYRSQGLL